jgi:hypothetical protein
VPCVIRVCAHVCACVPVRRAGEAMVQQHKLGFKQQSLHSADLGAPWLADMSPVPASPCVSDCVHISCFQRDKVILSWTHNSDLI